MKVLLSVMSHPCVESFVICVLVYEFVFEISLYYLRNKHDTAFYQVDVFYKTVDSSLEWSISHQYFLWPPREALPSPLQAVAFVKANLQRDS